MKPMKQSSFEFTKNFKPAFGGSLLAGKRKTARPLSVKSPMHFILKSSNARKSLSFVNHRHHIEKLIANVSKKFQVKIYEMAVNFDHLHLVIKLPHRSVYPKWIRALTSAIVQLLAKRTGESLKDFFSLRPYSIIVTWGRQFRTVLEYQIKNHQELFGIFRSPKKRKRKTSPSKN